MVERAEPTGGENSERRLNRSLGRPALGCGATITEAEADVAAGLEILAAVRRAQIELGGCKVLRRSPPICGCCLLLWRRWRFRVARQLVFHRDADDSHRGGWGEMAESSKVMRDVASSNRFCSRFLCSELRKLSGCSFQCSAIHLKRYPASMPD